MKRILCLLMLCVSSAIAQPDEAVQAYIAGDYSRVVALTQESDQADDLAFSARATLAEAMSMTSGEPSLRALKLAENLAQNAMTIDENHIEARLQLAISLSLQARPMSNRQAMRSGLGQTSRDLAEDILTDDPDNVYANALLAIWNMEVLRRGGRIGARIMGASVRDGRGYYAAAAGAAPDDGALHWQWARVLAATNPKKYRSEIEAALTASIAAQPDDVLEEVMQARAKRLYALLASEDFSGMKSLAASLL